MRDYLDSENDPQDKNPHFKKNIDEILKKIQQKPKLEPASTKSLDLLMAVRRKEMEEKQRKEEQKKEEDKQRLIKQNKLKERVVNSKYLVDNRKALEESRKDKQENFKESLRKQALEYKIELEKRKQKIYNMPLNFEKEHNATNKLKNQQRTKELVEEIISEDTYE